MKKMWKKIKGMKTLGDGRQCGCNEPITNKMKI
jgi:hypothetical protein